MEGSHCLQGIEQPDSLLFTTDYGTGAQVICLTVLWRVQHVKHGGKVTQIQSQALFSTLF